MTRKSWIAVVVIGIVAMTAGITWALWTREAPEVTRVKEIANKMFDRENVPDEERQAMREEMRELRDKLPEEQRREVFREMGNQFRQRMQDHIREFAALPPEERNAFLDKDIDRMESMRRQWEQRRGERGDRAGGRGGPGGPGRDGGRAGGDGQRRDRDRSPEARAERRRARLDNSSLEDRAYMSEYMKAINERREERGMEPMGRGPWRR